MVSFIPNYDHSRKNQAIVKEDSKMPATRLVCGVPGCKLGPEENGEGTPYQTAVHLSKIDETQKDMDQHLLVHSLMLGVVNNGTRNPPSTEKVKAEKIPRPQLKDECTDSDWSFFPLQVERIQG